MEISNELLSLIIASLSALGTAGILIQNYFSSQKLDNIQSHFQAEKESPDWEITKIRTDREGATYPQIIPDIENTGDGTAINVEIEALPQSESEERTRGHKDTKTVKKVYPGNTISVKPKIDENTDKITVIVRSDGEEYWKEHIDLEEDDFDDRIEKKLGRM